jgi:hypothetical protein
MKRTVILLNALLLLCAFAAASHASEAQFVRVKKPFANVYEFLDPQSKIVVQAKKGDYYPLVYEGTSWYQVKVKEQVGWLEKRAGQVVSSRNTTIFSLPVPTFVLVVILLAATFGVSLFMILRHKPAGEI